MRRPTQLVLTMLLAGTLVAPGALAEEATADPCLDDSGSLVLETQRAYVKATANKVGNLAAFGQGAFPTWNAEAPTQSGTGGMYVINRSYSTPGDDARISATFEGGFTGCLDTIAMELYAPESADRVRDGSNLRPYLTIDGRYVYENQASYGTVLSRTPDPTGIPGTVRYRVAFTGIHDKLKAAGLSVGGAHTVRLSFSPQFLNNSNLVFLYDGVQAPTGLTFNGATEGHTVLAANRP
jgi:hypothetical protein